MKHIRIREKIVNYLLILSLIVLALGVGVKVTRKNQRLDFSMDIETISVTNMEGELLRLIDLARQSKETYFFIFRLHDCYSCIAKGIGDIENLKTTGCNCAAIAVHDSLDEVKGFATMFSDVTFYQMTISDQYRHIHSPILPVMVKFKDGRLVSHLFITP